MISTRKLKKHADINNIKSVLLIDDERENTEYLGEALERAGYEVIVVETCTDAVRVLASRELSVVILDVEFSKQEKDKFLRAMNEFIINRPELIMLTSPSSLSREDAYDVWGASYCTSKPIDADVLVVKVNKLLSEESLVDSKSSLKNKFSVTLKISTKNVGRGGFSIPAATEEALEGDSVDFDLHISNDTSDRERLRGRGIIRYISLDQDHYKPKSWGVEMTEIHEEDAEKYGSMRNKLNSQTQSYIPKLWN